VSAHADLAASCASTMSVYATAGRYTVSGDAFEIGREGERGSGECNMAFQTSHKEHTPRRLKSMATQGIHL